MLKDNILDFIDGLSLGDDPNEMCRDIGLCDMSMEEFGDMLKEFDEHIQKQKEEKENNSQEEEVWNSISWNKK